MIEFLKMYKMWIALIGVVVLGAGSAFLLARNQTPTLPEAHTVELHDVREIVSVTGRVRAADDVDLAFEKSGRIASIPVRIGQFVVRGATLAALESSESVAALREAEARVKSEEAKLAEVQRGARGEEIAVSSAKVDQAKKSVEDARRSLIDAVRDMYTTSDDAIRNKSDQFFSNPRTSAVQLSGFVMSDSELKLQIEEERRALETMFSTWISVLPASGEIDSVDVDFDTAQKNGARVSSFLNKVSLAVNSASPSSSLSQTTIDGWRSAISSARTAVAADAAALTTKREAVRSAESSLAVVEREHSLKVAGAATEEVRIAEASLEQARAGVLSAKAQLSKNTLRAPFDGIVTNIEVDRGEIISANTSAISLISRARFEIETNIPEADISRVSVGAKADVTLDAYGSDIVFAATVVSVDPAETLLEGVATYRAVLQFGKQDERIRSGMTANIDVRGKERLQVTAIPQRAVIVKNGARFVQKIEGEKVVEVPIEVGLRGSDGFVEIVQGLSSGDKIVVYQNEE